MTPHDPTLYPRYLLKAVNAFTRRDQRLAAMSDAELFAGIDMALNRLQANAADVLALPYRLPGDWRDAHDQREAAEERHA